MQRDGKAGGQEGSVSKYREKIIIGSRESVLAVRQSELVLDYLRKNYPGMQAELVTMKTTGDRILEKRLDEIGGKGLFVRELDLALGDGRTDLSVHSLKDMPAEIPRQLPVIGFSEREDPRDVLVLPAGMKAVSEMDLSRPIGTSSRRRILQAQDLFPGARFESVRGNVLTRLRKLDEGQYSALILAAAGLRRLDLQERISRYFSTEELIPSAGQGRYFSTEELIPSAGQGILALQGRSGEDYSCLDGFISRQSAIAAAAERSFVSALGGGCTSPIAAHAEFTDDAMTLRGFYYDDVTEKKIRKTITVQVFDPVEAQEAGRKLAAQVLEESSGRNASRQT